MKQKNQNNNPKFPIYWINRGYYESEGIQKIKEIQSNCAKKHKGLKKTPEQIERMKQFQNYYSSVEY